MSRFPLASVDPAFRAMAEAFVPELGQASSATWDRVRTRVAEALASRPPALVRQLRWFVRLADVAARIRTGHRLHALTVDHRIRFLRGLERGRLHPIRRGIWGLRTLVFLGYYTDPAVAVSLGYRAHRDGWGAR